MPLDAKTVLLLDDDPEHLKIYGLLVRQAGYASVGCLVRRACPELEAARRIDLVLLDYTLNCEVPTSKIAQTARASWPDVPIVLISDIYGLPDDIAPFINKFVRKGEPAKLIATLNDLLGKAEVETVDL